jgi:hypothetical protein
VLREAPPGKDSAVIHDHADEGLERDLKAPLRRADRRDVLRWLAAASVMPLIGCGGGGDSTTSGSDGGVASCSKIPEETQGPYPGDGSNGPNIHFEVYPTLSGATSSSNKIATSQMALPKTACDAVYATSAYSGSASNLSQVSLSDLWTAEHCEGPGIPLRGFLKPVNFTSPSAVVSYDAIHAPAFRLPCASGLLAESA